jgi:hypothetical protein
MWPAMSMLVLTGIDPALLLESNNASALRCRRKELDW